MAAASRFGEGQEGFNELKFPQGGAAITSLKLRTDVQRLSRSSRAGSLRAGSSRTSTSRQSVQDVRVLSSPRFHRLTSPSLSIAGLHGRSLWFIQKCLEQLVFLGKMGKRCECRDRGTNGHTRHHGVRCTAGAWLTQSSELKSPKLSN